MKITRKEIQKINKQLKQFNSYWCTIPLININSVLKENKLLLIQEDGTAFSGIFCGDSSNTNIFLGVYEKNSENEFYEMVENTSLKLSWYKMPSGNFEIVCYIS